MGKYGRFNWVEKVGIFRKVARVFYIQTAGRPSLWSFSSRWLSDSREHISKLIVTHCCFAGLWWQKQKIKVFLFLWQCNITEENQTDCSQRCSTLWEIKLNGCFNLACRRKKCWTMYSMTIILTHHKKIPVLRCIT